MQYYATNAGSSTAVADDVEEGTGQGGTGSAKLNTSATADADVDGANASGAGAVENGVEQPKTTNTLDDGECGTGASAKKSGLYMEEGERGSSAVQKISNKFPNDNQAGKRFNYTTENGRVHIENSVQNVDFVIDMDGNLYVGRGHSYLANGCSVQAAGTMKVNSQGYIRLITNESGHFQPTTVQSMNYPTVFKSAGLNIDNSWIRIGEFETSMSNYVIDSKVFYNGPIKNMP